MTRVKAAVLIILLFSQIAGAASIYEAETYYKSATTFYNEDDYENALRDIEMSKEAYLELGDSRGIAKANTFIRNNLDSIITPGQMAGMYFNIGGDYYIQAQGEDLDLLVRAQYFTVECEKRYRNISGTIGTSGVLKCQDLNNRITDLITKIRSSRKNDAKILYEESQKAYRDEELVLARELVINASRIYNSIPDANGITKTAALLTSVENRIQDIQINAQTSYKTSLDLTVQNQWKKARDYAIAAQDLYQSIGDDEGYAKAAQLLNRINDEIQTDREERLRQAQSLFLDAQEFYTLQQYQNATFSAQEAKRIYEDFLAEAKIKERNLHSSLQVETRLFENHISEVNKLLYQIMGEYGYERMLEQAEILYSKAQEYYTLNRLEDALAYARNSYSMFEELEYYIGMSKSNSLIKTINQRTERLREASAILDTAKTYFSVADFDNAYYEATRAQQMYQELWLTERTNYIDGLLQNITKGRVVKTRSDQHFSTSMGHMDAGNYKEALSNAQQAHKGYTEINYSIGMQESQRIMDEAQETIDAEYRQFRNTVIVLVLVGGLILFVIISWRSRAQKMETEFQRQQRLQKEKRRRDKEAWSLEKEEETKDAVEDELKRLIREERQLKED